MLPNFFLHSLNFLSPYFIVSDQTANPAVSYLKYLVIENVKSRTLFIGTLQRVCQFLHARGIKTMLITINLVQM